MPFTFSMLAFEMELSVDADTGALPHPTSLSAGTPASTAARVRLPPQAEADVGVGPRPGPSAVPSPAQQSAPHDPPLTPAAEAKQGDAGDPERAGSPRRRPPPRGVTTATPAAEGGWLVNPLAVKAGRIGPTGESILSALTTGAPQEAGRGATPMSPPPTSSAVNEPVADEDTGTAVTSPSSVRAPRPARRAAQRESWCRDADGRCQCSNFCSCGLLLATLLVTVIYWALHCTSVLGVLTNSKDARVWVDVTPTIEIICWVVLLVAFLHNIMVMAKITCCWARTAKKAARVYPHRLGKGMPEQIFRWYMYLTSSKHPYYFW